MMDKDEFEKRCLALSKMSHYRAMATLPEELKRKVSSNYDDVWIKNKEMIRVKQLIDESLKEAI